jgi:hypothetical protein
LSTIRPFLGVIVVAAIALGYGLCHLDPAGSYPGMPQGPGLTLDETFNVQQGVILVEGLRTYGPGVVFPEGLHEVFSPPLHLPDHPPLGRLWLGLHHHLAWWFSPPEDPDGPFVTACARAGSVTAFALTILLVGGMATVWYGEWAGLMAAMAFGIVPRLVGHAHLASLESITNLMCTLATLVVAQAWDQREPPKLRTAAWTGIFFGLALLTKIQAILIPIPVAILAILRWRRPGVRPLLVWGLVGGLVFFIGWPWLWLDPVGHGYQYFRGAADRLELGVWYGGARYTHKTVPWHYAPVYFLWTVPLKLVLVGLLGAWGAGKDLGDNSEVRNAALAKRLPPRDIFLFVAACWPLVFFAMPGIPIYDCERLWLTVVPLWMILVGRGADVLLRRLETVKYLNRTKVCLIFLTIAIVQQVYFLRIAPHWLNFYSVTAAPWNGRESPFLERDYWASGITREFLAAVVRQVPRGTKVGYAPILHQFQLIEYTRQSPILRKHDVAFVPYEPDNNQQQYVVIYQRRADLPPEFLQHPQGWTLLAETQVDGRRYAALYQRGQEAAASVLPDAPEPAIDR